MVPDYVLGFSWTEAYGIGGFTDVLADRPWLGVNSAVGVWAALTVGAVPLTYLVVAAGLSARAEPSLVRAARASGARPAAVLWTITLPLLRPAIAAATVLCFALSLQAFAIPQVMGTPAGFRTVTTEIYRNLSLGSDPQSFVAALVLALLLVLITVLVVGPADAWLGPRLRVRRAGGRRTRGHGSDPQRGWCGCGRGDRRFPVVRGAAATDRAARHRRDARGRRAAHPGQLDCRQLHFGDHRAHPGRLRPDCAAGGHGRRAADRCWVLRWPVWNVAMAAG